MFIVGMTGGIGSGKSAVSHYFYQQNITIIDADILAREVVLPGKLALKKIVDHYGSSILSQDKTLNRTKLRKIIFNDIKEKIWLETLLHPLINQRFKEQLSKAKTAYTIFVSPLLIETTQKNEVHRILVIDVEEKIQIMRTMQRDKISIKSVQNIINTQVSRQDRLAVADDIIENNQSVEVLFAQVQLLHQNYLAYAASFNKYN